MMGTWIAPHGGSWQLETRVKDANGRTVALMANGIWKEAFVYQRSFEGQWSSPEEQTLLVLVEESGELSFERLIDGAVIASATLEVETMP